MTFLLKYNLKFILDRTTTYLLKSSLVAQTVKNLPAVPKNWVRSLGQEDPLEKGMATYSSILAWRIPWTEMPDSLQSTRLQSRTQLRHSFFFSVFNWRIIALQYCVSFCHTCARTYVCLWLIHVEVCPLFFEQLLKPHLPDLNVL